MFNVYVVNKKWLNTHNLYSHFIFTLFVLFIFYSIYCYLEFVLFIFPTLFINISIFFIFYVSFLRTIFLNQCVSLFIDKRVVLPLLLHNLIFSCHISQDGDLAGDCITREMKVYALKDNNDNNNNNNNNNINNNNNKFTYYFFTL